MRKFLAGAVVTALVLVGAGYGALSQGSGVNVKRQADKYAIERIEKTWHRAASTKNLNLMMSLWAPRAIFTYAGTTYRGKAQIRGFLAKSGPFQPQNHWISETPAYKIRVTVHGNRGTLYFECHYIDYETKQLKVWVAADNTVQKINGRWLIVTAQGSTPELKP